MNEENNLQAQGIFDAFRLLDKDLIDKILSIAKTIKIENSDDGKTTKITVELVNQK